MLAGGEGEGNDEAVDVVTAEVVPASEFFDTPRALPPPSPVTGISAFSLLPDGFLAAGQAIKNDGDKMTRRQSIENDCKSML